MSDIVYDLPIREVAEMLDKSDRQVRRYVKEKKLPARAVRIEGHVRLMFNSDDVRAFRQRFNEEGILTSEEMSPEEGVIIDAQLIDRPREGSESEDETVIDAYDVPDSGAVKYVIDVLKEQISELRDENRRLHREVEERAGLIGFWQGRAEILQEEVKALMPIPKPEDEKMPWYRRVFGRRRGDG
ncbi:MAG: helix-turn-helix domain-containing protein [Armatimonadetes bacterium]|nr:helix-turn-helix domain-containing protein [Armatimonadota bacterium]